MRGIGLVLAEEDEEEEEEEDGEQQGADEALPQAGAVEEEPGLEQLRRRCYHRQEQIYSYLVHCHIVNSRSSLESK